MRICGRCGVYAPEASAVCDGCGADLGAHARVVPEPAQRCVAIRLEFRCRKCELWSPLDFLDLDGQVRCARCGTDQAFEEKKWKKILDRAHAVADLFGASPEGREVGAFAIDAVNPFAREARRRSGVRFAEDEADAWRGWLPEGVRAWMGPGVPLSGDTAEPLALRPEGGGVLAVPGRDGAPQRWNVPVRAVGLHRSLLGAIADEHRSARTEPEIVVENLAYRCAGCGAGLRIDGLRPLVRCDYCNLVVHVSARLRHSLSADPVPETWWLVFDGPSPYRSYLERHPSTWEEGYPDERGVEDPPAASSATHRALAAAWVLLLPTLALLGVGAMSRLPVVLAWLRSWVGGGA